MQKQVLLEAKDVCKSFANNGNQNHVLDHVNVSLYKGDFTVIMGTSGSGKSTLLYCLSGMDNVTSGDVFFRGDCISRYKEKEMARLRAERFGFVFQQMHLVSNLSLYENVVVPGYLLAAKASDVEERARQLLEQVHVEDASNRLPSQVSGGEAQRAAIARSIINTPEMLFADEPTGALNRKNTKSVLELLSQLNEAGQSILMVTHDVKAASRANRLLYLADGQIGGEITLPSFATQPDLKSREAQVNAWLTSLEW